MGTEVSTEIRGAEELETRHRDKGRQGTETRHRDKGRRGTDKAPRQGTGDKAAWRELGFVFKLEVEVIHVTKNTFITLIIVYTAIIIF